MRGSSKSQVTAIVREIFEEGYDKHEAKSQLSGDNHQKSQFTKIGSFETMDKYASTWHNMASWCRNELSIKDITKIDNNAVSQYFEHRYSNDDLTKKGFGDVCAAVNKFQVGINMFQEKLGGEKVDWQAGLAHGRELKAEMSDTESRIKAYERPLDLINANCLSPQEKAIGAFILETGARIGEVWGLKEKDIANGFVELHGKGGLDRIVQSELAPQALSVLRELRAEGYSQNNLRDAFKKASAETGQQYQCVHGLRHNYAIEQYNYKVGVENKTDYQARYEVSRSMGHFRPDIVLVYLK